MVLTLVIMCECTREGYGMECQLSPTWMGHLAGKTPSADNGIFEV